MSDCIRREDAIMAAMDYNGCGNAQDASQDIAADLASIPAADVRENIHGKWIPAKCDPDFLRCSICGEGKFAMAWNPKNLRKTFRFCPWCGADMRGEKDDRVCK